MIGTTRQFVIAIVLASLIGILATICLATAEQATATPESMNVIATHSR